MKLNRFARFTWGFLAYNLLVILWGAYVRATGSGAGCGAHWPLCNGQVIPQTAQVATMVEFIHRLMSGLTLLGSFLLVVWAWRAYPRKHPIRLTAGLSLLFTLTEALVGAGLVLLELVANNASATRAASVAVHLVNTLLLLGAITWTAWLASGGKVPHWLGHERTGLWFSVALVAVIILSASGAITALGDTLFPSGSVAEGLAQDISPTAHFLIRLRVYHPVIAILTGAYLVVTILLKGFGKVSPSIRQISKLVLGLFVVQIAFGVSNVLLLAPMWLQMVHLFVSDLVWISLVCLTLMQLGEPSLNRQPAAKSISRAETS